MARLSQISALFLRLARHDFPIGELVLVHAVKHLVLGSVILLGLGVRPHHSASLSHSPHPFLHHTRQAKVNANITLPQKTGGKNTQRVLT